MERRLSSLRPPRHKTVWKNKKRYAYLVSENVGNHHLRRGIVGSRFLYNQFLNRANREQYEHEAAKYSIVNEFNPLPF